MVEPSHSREPRSFQEHETEAERVAAQLRAQIERLKAKVQALLPAREDAEDRR